MPQAVAAFREWLLNLVIDLEVEAGTASPTIDPSVHVVLCGHSMGGIVAADALLSIANDTAEGLVDEDGDEKGRNGMGIGGSEILFPDIKGVLAFDTPYLGIAPSVLAHGAETHYNTATTVINQLQNFGVFGNTAKASTSAATNASASALGGGSGAMKALPPPDMSGAGIPWAKWGKMAVYAGAAAAVAAGSAAAYNNREAITQGVSWATSHLEFVGCLMRPEDLRKRVARIEDLSTTQTQMTKFEPSKDPRMAAIQQDSSRSQSKERESPLGRIGWMCLYTKLGKAAASSQGDNVSVTGTLMGTGQSGRTFCNLPKGQGKAHWREEINDMAKDEVTAHMDVFDPKQNPGFEALLEHAVEYVALWTKDVLKVEMSSGTTVANTETTNPWA